MLLARTLCLSSTVYDCGSTHLVEYEIKTKKHLKKLSGKYFKENKDDLDLKLLKPKKYQNLVGKKIFVRSAVTCCLGDEVCHVCMGITSNTNADIADGISAFESEEVTKRTW